MTYVRQFIRTLLFSTALICYFIASFSIFFLCGLNLERARPLLTKVISLTSKVGLKIFNVHVRKHFAFMPGKENFLIVSNHLSYLDILIIGSFFPSCFVTSKEMKETPFLGQICMLGGCLFVERRSKAGISNEVRELTHSLQKGLNVTIFPEATSTNGEAVIRFRRPLFQAAINAHVNVLPVCLNYRTLDGEKITLKNRDKVFWYGDMVFFTHVIKLFGHEKIVADFTLLAPLDTGTYSDKNTLADKCFEVVAEEYEIITHAL